jgi:hypothetical protein
MIDDEAKITAEDAKPIGRSEAYAIACVRKKIGANDRRLATVGRSRPSSSFSRAAVGER